MGDITKLGTHNQVLGAKGLKGTDKAAADKTKNEKSANQAQENHHASSLAQGENHYAKECPAGSAQPAVDMAATAATVGAVAAGTLIGGIFGGIAAGVATNKVLAKDRAKNCEAKAKATEPTVSATDAVKSGAEAAAKTVGKALKQANKVVMEFVEAAQEGMRIPANNVQDVHKYVKESETFTKKEKSTITKFMADLNSAGSGAKKRMDNYLKSNGVTEAQLHKIAENNMTPQQVLDAISRGDGGV